MQVTGQAFTKAHRKTFARGKLARHVFAVTSWPILINAYDKSVGFWAVLVDVRPK